MITSKEDYELIKLIDSLSDGELNYYSKVYVALDLRHYITLQLTWMEEEKYFLGMELHHDPSEEEMITAWIKHHNSERFRAFYVLKYPEKVKKS